MSERDALGMLVRMGCSDDCLCHSSRAEIKLRFLVRGLAYTFHLRGGEF